MRLPRSLYSLAMTKSAFTLAEVLVTLGIIGVVAALTLPSLIANHKEKEAIVKVKKVYSILSQAYTAVINEYETPDNWGWDSEAGAVVYSVDLAEKFMPYLNVIQDCGYGEGCFPDLKYKKFDGGLLLNFHENPIRYMVKLADGSVIAFMGLKPNDVNGYWGGFYYDTNGDKGPNQFGKDLFQIEIMKDRLVGLYTDKPEDVLPDCITNGFSCLAWILANDNMDYLHCPDDLDWNTKTTCK